MKKSNRQRLFEMMEKVNPNFNKTYFHGTTKSRADNIRKVGFYPQHNVNITDDYSEALEYAEMIAEDENDTPEIMEVYLKDGATPKAEEGLDSMAYDSKDVILKR
ncbi:MAG: hypothetical protein WC333_01210 [Dehalococcoidia bacterium]|jgi:glucuronate isomerase